MSWPSSVVTTGELVTAAQLNLLPIRLADVVLGAAAASIDVTSIPAIYSHLSLVVTTRSATASVDSVMLRMNGDATGIYYYQSMYAKGSSYLASEGLAQTSMQVGSAPGTSAPSAAYFSSCEIWLPYYAGATHKTVVSAWAYRPSAATLNTYVGQSTGTWASTAAINRLTLSLAASNLATNSVLSLYGWV